MSIQEIATVLSIGTEIEDNALSEVAEKETLVAQLLAAEDGHYSEEDVQTISNNLRELSANGDCKIVFVVRDGTRESTAIAERIISGLEKTKIIDVPLSNSVEKLQSAMSMLRVDSTSSVVNIIDTILTSILVHGFISFDFQDWVSMLQLGQHFCACGVKGKKNLVENLMEELDKAQNAYDLPTVKGLVLIVHGGQELMMDDLRGVNDFFEKMPDKYGDDFMVKWSVANSHSDNFIDLFIFW